MTENDTIKALNEQWHIGYKQGFEDAANKFILSSRQFFRGYDRGRMDEVEE